MSAFSRRRFLAVLRKEWIQVRRDPMTLRLIIALPVMQLFLFGFVINSAPKHLPTGVLSADHSRDERTLLAALRNTCYYTLEDLPSEGAAERALAEGKVLFVVDIPAKFERSIDRGETPRSSRAPMADSLGRVTAQRIIGPLIAPTPATIGQNCTYPAAPATVHSPFTKQRRTTLPAMLMTLDLLPMGPISNMSPSLPYSVTRLLFVGS
jgi:ABC-2 type transport system permease protein